MTSILTNASAMSALQTLRNISSSMEDTQAHISSGLRVGSAKDNAAYWSIATTMRSDNDALSAVQDALGLGAAKVDTAYAGMNSAIDVVKQIKEKIVAAKEPGVDKTKIQEEITQLQQQLTSISQSASFSGENWLQTNLTATPTTTKSVVGSFVRDSSGNVSIKTIDYTMNANTVLFDDGGNTGLLDKTWTVSSGPSVTLDVNKNGVQTSFTVKAYAVESLIKNGAFFQGDVASVNAANTNLGNTAAAFFVKTSSGSWVQAVSHSAGSYAGFEALAYNGAANANVNTATEAWYYVNTAATAGNATTTFSVATLNVSSDNLDLALSAVEAALGKMTSTAATLGAASARLDLQEDFMSKLRDAITGGVGRLVDADMNEESTKLKALQTQQQLAIQALSIANSDSQGILTLFR